MMISPDDLDRYHTAARMIEDDMDEAYFSCRRRFGADAAGLLLVALLRQKMNDKPDQWPPPDDLREKVNKVLKDKGLLH